MKKKRVETIDLDELLHGNPSWSDVAAFFKDGEFHEEHYAVAAIKKHLLTSTHQTMLDSIGHSIEDALSGRVRMAVQPTVDQIFHDWNAALGFHHFGYERNPSQPVGGPAVFWHEIAKVQVEYVGLFLMWLLYESGLFGDLRERQRTWPEREREMRLWKETYDRWFFQIRMEGTPIEEADFLARDMLKNLGIREFA